MGYKVVIIDDRYDGYEEEKEVLRKINVEPVNITGRDEDEIIRECRGADGIIVNLAPLTGKVIESLEKCRVISRYGVGVDAVDVQAATRRGIWVANVPDYCDEDVSDQACALFLSCVRNTALRDRQVKSGVWDIKSAPPQHRIKGKTFVLFGYGRIARAMHRKIRGFLPGKILVCDPYLGGEEIKKEGAEKVDFEKAVSAGDFFSIHMPLNEQTRGIFNESVFKKMKPGAIIINTSRGGLVNERDLYRALAEGTLGAAGIDVFEEEPTSRDNPLLALDNITVSGHTGFYTEESLAELKTKAALNITETLINGKPEYPVNKKEQEK
jgi:D-3-phosphoglycerate dehydrogenase / 2-oxoglutarate reductase